MFEFLKSKKRKEQERREKQNLEKKVVRNTTTSVNRDNNDSGIELYSLMQIMNNDITVSTTAFPHKISCDTAYSNSYSSYDSDSSCNSSSSYSSNSSDSSSSYSSSD